MAKLKARSLAPPPGLDGSPDAGTRYPAPGSALDPRRHVMLWRAPDLSSEVIAILLRGWSAEPPVPSGLTGFGHGFLELGVTGGPGPGGLWQRHEAFLRAVAAQWGWTPGVKGPDGRVRFYGEHCAAGFQDHEAPINSGAATLEAAVKRSYRYALSTGKDGER